MSFAAPAPKKPKAESEQPVPVEPPVEAEGDKNVPAPAEENEAPREFPPLAYQAPQWSAPCRFNYSLDVLKNGTIIDTIDISEKEFYVVGRLPNCDIVLDHTTISRYHAVFQHSQDGWVHLYDLKSTHGTKANKASLPARKFVRLKVGSVIKFGDSTRLYILNGPQQYENFGETMTGESADQLMRAPEEPEQSEGISWGMADDTAPEYNIPENRELDTSEDAWFMKDPKKILKNWMEHHGYDFDFTYEEHMEGKEKQYAARISLPIETGFGAYAMGLGSRKKDAERECAVDACRKLDAAGILRSDPAEISSKKRERIKAMLGEDDSDEDTFYDRTGLIEKKKSKPKKVEPQVETFESLNKKKEELAEEIAGVENEIRDVELKLEAQKNLDMSDLDVYMSSLSSTVTDVTKYKLEKKLEELQKSMAKLNQLIKIATPSLGSFSTIHGLKEAEKPAPKADPKPEAPKKVELPKVVDPTAFASFRPDDEEEEEEDDRSREKPQPQPQPQPQARPAEPQPVVKRAPTQVPTIPNPDAKRKIAEVSEEAKEEEEGKQTEAGTQQRAEKKKRVYGAMTKERFDELTGGDELVAWEPPKNQTGDGRTSLNDKFGY